MPVAPLLQRFVDDELARASLLGEQACAGAVRNPVASGRQRTAGRPGPGAARGRRSRCKERGAFAAFAAALAIASCAALENPSAQAPNATSGQTGVGCRWTSRWSRPTSKSPAPRCRSTAWSSGTAHVGESADRFTSALRGDAASRRGPQSDPACDHRAPLPSPERALGDASGIRPVRATAGAIGSRPIAVHPLDAVAQPVPDVRRVSRPGQAHRTPCSPGSHRSPSVRKTRRRRILVCGAAVGPGDGGLVGAGGSVGATAHGDAAIERDHPVPVGPPRKASTRSSSN